MSQHVVASHHRVRGDAGLRAVLQYAQALSCGALRVEVTQPPATIDWLGSALKEIQVLWRLATTEETQEEADWQDQPGEEADEVTSAPLGPLWAYRVQLYRATLDFIGLHPEVWQEP